MKLHFRGKREPLSLPALLGCPPAELIARLESMDLDQKGLLVTRDIVPQIRERLKFMGSEGLGYLSLDRPTKTLSGGEAQRIRLAAQLGTNTGPGVLYVLDEPSIGLHARDNMRLIATLLSLRDKGNTLVVVEHDDELMGHADLIVDLGPGAGVHGGELLALGSPAQIRRNNSSLTGIFLARGLRHPQRGSHRGIGRRDIAGPWIELTGACHRTLEKVDLRIPPGRLTMVAGPSGAGKSTLFRDVLGPAVAFAVKSRSPRVSGRAVARASKEAKPHFAELRNAQDFRSVIEVDQSPIGRTPRSTPATYLGIFDLIRKFFASLPGGQDPGLHGLALLVQHGRGRCPRVRGGGRQDPPRDGVHARTPTCPATTARACATGRSCRTSPGRGSRSGRCCG